MNRSINASVRLFSETFQPNGPVLEIGSRYLPGYDKLCNLRCHFQGLQYIGSDIRPGLGVDLIVDGQAVGCKDGSAGTVLLLEILEHLPHPDKAIAEAKRVLRGDGLLVLSVPFNYRLHGFPSDYWRFTASGVYTLLQDFPDKIIFALGPKVKPSFIFAVATTTASRDFTQRKTRFQARVHETFRRRRIAGHISVFKERSREFFGHLLGRASLSVSFFDPSQGGGYTNKA